MSCHQKRLGRCLASELRERGRGPVGDAGPVAPLCEAVGEYREDHGHARHGRAGRRPRSSASTRWPAGAALATAATNSRIWLPLTDASASSRGVGGRASSSSSAGRLGEERLRLGGWIGAAPPLGSVRLVAGKLGNRVHCRPDVAVQAALGGPVEEAGWRAPAERGRARRGVSRLAARFSATRAAEVPAAPFRSRSATASRYCSRRRLSSMRWSSTSACAAGMPPPSTAPSSAAGSVRASLDPVLVVPAARRPPARTPRQALPAAPAIASYGITSLSVTCGATASAARMSRAANPAGQPGRARPGWPGRRTRRAAGRRRR